MCVEVPFGNGNKLRKGYCIGMGEVCKFDPARIKEVRGVVDGGVGIEGKMISLAGWIRKNYGSTMIQALKTVLPAKRSVKKVEHRTIQRISGREEIISLMGESGRRGQVAKERLLRELTEQETIPYEWVTGKLGVSPQTVSSLEKVGVIRILRSQTLRNPVKLEQKTDQKKLLSNEQRRIVDEVMADFDAGKPDVYLLHGITGSGKTFVYMQIVKEMVERGRQCIVLIPEIALTYQTLLR
ncbi:MAG TPA: primosomal protein N', partial [Lachnospiraceae bacterium]|nr:primosomal protein N' [Lachnospiraceae bacterium]